MKTATFHFAPDLHVFLEPAFREDPLVYPFQGPQSVKHLFEAVGVPHTEVSQILVNGSPVDKAYLVQDGDQVEVRGFSQLISPDQPHPTSRSEDSCQSPAEAEPRFILDNHLGRLASYLRMLGFDCLYHNHFQDEQLASLAQAENRILLTRDHRLLMRKTIARGYWLRSQDPRQQVREVVVRFQLASLVKPFRRCMRCNAELVSVSKESILDRLQPLTKKYFTDFRLCPACNQLYWQGSHYTKMLAFIDQITFTSPVTQHLTAKGIPFRLFQHSDPPSSLAQAALERGQNPDQVVRSILFRLGEGRFALVLVAGDRQISWTALRRFFGQSRLTLATPTEVLQVTSYPLGAVSPFGLPQPIPILVDQSVFSQEEISLGSGVRGTAVILKTADFLRALDAHERGSFTQI